MSYFVTGSGFLTEYEKLTDNTATDVLDFSQGVMVASVICTETLGSTPNLTIAVYDAANTTAYYLRNAKAMMAKETVSYTEPFWVPNGWTVQITSSNASGGVDVVINYFNPNATARAS